MAYGNVNVAVPGVSNDESSYLKTEQAGAPGGVVHSMNSSIGFSHFSPLAR